MTQSVEAITTSALSIAIQAATRRHQVISANLANANTQGYAPIKLAFEEHLQEARDTLRHKGQLDAAALASIRMDVNPVLDSAGNAQAVRADEQLADMAANAVHHQALLQGLSRHLGLVALAVADGRK
jgi:flagellar basal-body rod protein FlgB